MMKNSRKTFIKVLQRLLVLATLITMIVIGIFLWNLVSNTPNDDEPPIVTEPEYVFTLEDYTYYKSDELDFNFVIVDIKISSNVSIKLPLSTLSTSEGISLSSTDSYLSELASNNLKPSLKGLSFSFNSDSKELIATIFIPVQSKILTEIRLNSNVVPYSEVKIDLSNTSKLGNIADLKLEDNTVINDPNEDLSFTLGFSDYFEPSNFYTVGANGENVSVDLSTGYKIFGISYIVENSSTFSYKISSAELIIEGFSSFQLLNPEYLVVSITNLATISLLESKEGLLFFVLPSQDINVFSYNKNMISLKLNFANNQEMIIENAIGN
jgi:hypothetical protein